jgi:hypothetical protein
MPAIPRRLWLTALVLFVLAPGGATATDTRDAFEVLLTAGSTDTHRTFLVVPKTAGDRSPRAVDPASVVTLIVSLARSPADDAVILERFAKEPSDGQTHLRLDLPDGVLGVDVHHPSSYTVARLEEVVDQSNMEAFAGFQFKEQGKALYSALYAQFAAFKEATAIQATPIGEFDSTGIVTIISPERD